MELEFCIMLAARHNAVSRSTGLTAPVSVPLLQVSLSYLSLSCSFPPHFLPFLRITHIVYSLSLGISRGNTTGIFPCGVGWVTWPVKLSLKWPAPQFYAEGHWVVLINVKRCRYLVVTVTRCWNWSTSRTHTYSLDMRRSGTEQWTGLMWHVGYVVPSYLQSVHLKWNNHGNTSCNPCYSLKWDHGAAAWTSRWQHIEDNITHNSTRGYTISLDKKNQTVSQVTVSLWKSSGVYCIQFYTGSFTITDCY